MSRYFDESDYEVARSAIKQLRNDARSYYEYYHEQLRKNDELEQELKAIIKERNELLKFRAAYEALQE